MANRSTRFSAVPNIPQGAFTPLQFNVLNSLKENVELLIGARGVDKSAHAILKGHVTVANPPAQRMVRVSASGAGYTINGVTVPSLDDYGKLISDVQQLAEDVANLRTVLNVLINQLKG